MERACLPQCSVSAKPHFAAVPNTSGIFYFTIMENKQDEFIGLPDWVNFIATDKNGCKCGYQNRPKISNVLHFWIDHQKGNAIDIGIDHESAKNWENSLIERQKS